MAIVDGDANGQLTDSGATVGAVTLGGTLQLFLVTMIAGVIGGFLYLGVRSWIPAIHLPKRFVFGRAVMIVPGIVIFNTDNPDLQIFGPVLRFHGPFVGICVLFGTIVAWVAARLHPKQFRPTAPNRVGRAIAREVAVLVVVIGLHLFVAGGILEGVGTCLLADDRGGCSLSPATADGP